MPLKQHAIFYAKVLKDAVTSYLGDDMPANAAALAFYMIFSLPAMLFIVLWTAGRFYRDVAVRERRCLHSTDVASAAAVMDRPNV